MPCTHEEPDFNLVQHSAAKCTKKANKELNLPATNGTGTEKS